jgi:hypothetical protein
LVDDFLSHLFAFWCTLIKLANKHISDLIQAFYSDYMKFEPLAIISNLPEETTTPEYSRINFVKVIL